MNHSPMNRAPLPSGSTSEAHTRRDALKAMLIPSVGLPMVAMTDSVTGALLAPAITSTNAVIVSAPPTEPLNRFPRMVHEFFVQQVRDAEKRNVAAQAVLRSRADAEDYVRSVRERIRQSFGPSPERTPLNSRVTGRVERDGYVIENVIFESRPGFPVTANLYLPTNRSGRVPGVVGTCGHSSNGKAAEAYQQFAQGLVRLGMACLIYDPIGQGERFQYVSDKLSSTKGAGVQEHLHGGNQQFLVGEYLCSWMVWDGMRALDYLLTRAEVNSDQIGVTGNSGGGTQTTWLTGTEARWAMSAPSCFVTTFRRNLENELPADTEQCPPRAIALGLDHADFLAALAPRPVIILAKERDFFDVRGSEEAYQRLRHIYRLLGAEDNVALFVGPSGHGYSQENREAMYSWFSRACGITQSTTSAPAWANGILSTSANVPQVAEPQLQMEKDETLWCTPQGQVAALEGTRTVFDFTREKSRQLSESRVTLKSDALRVSVRNVLKVPALPQAVPDYRIWRNVGSRGYPKPQAVAYAIETEPEVQAIVYRLMEERWHSRPPESGPSAILYVAHLSSDAELRDEPLIKEVMAAEPESAVFACDVRGIGESMPGTCEPNSFHSPYGNDYFYAVHSLMLDRPYPGQKTFDVLRVLQWMESLGHSSIHLVARGWGALAGTFAAVLSDTVARVTLKHALTSYTDVAETEDYHWPLSTLVPNVLSHFDLPDCYAALAARNLRQVEPVSGSSGVK